ncbi:MAG: hypothetical protein R3296_10590 [Oleiphilaceae bacterium]|nr:hypothetical protein [Oleiphilaceae bacterium]
MPISSVSRFRPIAGRTATTVAVLTLSLGLAGCPVEESSDSGDVATQSAGAPPENPGRGPDGRRGPPDGLPPGPPGNGCDSAFCAGSAKAVITPLSTHVEGVEEERIAGTPKQQMFNLGGFGIDLFQNYPDPLGALGNELTEPVGDFTYTNQHGEEEHTWLRAMVFSQSDQQGEARQIAFVIVDAVGAGNVITNDLKTAVSESTGIAPDDILFGSTHSHAGADLQGLWGGVPEDWIRNVLYTAAVDAVSQAQSALCPSQLTVSQGQVPEFNSHRRLKVDPDAEADSHMTLLQAHCLSGPREGQVSGSLLQYSAHPTNIGPGDYREVPELEGRVAHADYILGAVEWLESQPGGGVALYYNGPIADASNRGPGGDNAYERSRNRGSAIAQATLGLKSRALPATMEVRHERALLPVTNPAFIAAGIAGSFNRYYDFLMLPTEEIPFLGPQFDYLPQLTPTAETVVTRVTLGGADSGLEIVTIPGEATNTFGEYIRDLASTDVMLLGLTQQAFGYIIPEEEFNYIDPTGGSGFVLPFTDYEEFLSLGPLTSPLLRLQAYNPLFGIGPSDTENLPPWLSPCLEDPRHPDCVTTDIGQNIDFIQRGYAQQCQESPLPDEFCALLNPDTPLQEPCLENGFPEDFCRVFGEGEG